MSLKYCGFIGNLTAAASVVFASAGKSLNFFLYVLYNSLSSALTPSFATFSALVVPSGLVVELVVTVTFCLVQEALSNSSLLKQTLFDSKTYLLI